MLNLLLRRLVQHSYCQRKRLLKVSLVTDLSLSHLLSHEDLESGFWDIESLVG